MCKMFPSLLATHDYYDTIIHNIYSMCEHTI